jgi:hypothetical protein
MAAAAHELRVGPGPLTVRSPARGTTAMARLRTPVGWTRGTHRRWPVRYLLHACCDAYQSWTRLIHRPDRLRGARKRRIAVVLGAVVGSVPTSAISVPTAHPPAPIKRARDLQALGHAASIRIVPLIYGVVA